MALDMENGGRVFALLVDSDHKATEFRLFSVAAPYLHSFHLSQLSFFCYLLSTFAAPALLLVIHDNLNLTTTDIGNARIAVVSDAIFTRIAIGAACDLFGPRLTFATLILLTASAVFCSAIADFAVAFLMVRFFTGFFLAMCHEDQPIIPEGPANLLNDWVGKGKRATGSNRIN